MELAVRLTGHRFQSLAKVERPVDSSGVATTTHSEEKFWDA
jgi:hypothetical protein